MGTFNRVAAAGAGSGLHDLVTMLPAKTELVAVADGNAALHGTSKFNAPVCSYSELAGVDFDVVVITAGAVDPIRQQLLDVGVAADKIVALCPSGSQRLIDDINIDLDRLDQGLGVQRPRAGLATMYLRFAEENHQASAWPVDFVRTQIFNLCAEQIKRRGVAGSVAELGVFRGDQAHLIAKLFPDRPFRLFDTFEGFAVDDLKTEQTAGYSVADVGDFADTSIDLVLAKLAQPERVIVHKGFFPATAEGVEDTFAFVSLDVDLHDPTAAGLAYFYPRLSPGGFIFVHDYNNGRYNGVRDAVEAFAAANTCCTIPIPDFSGSIVVMKP